MGDANLPGAVAGFPQEMGVRDLGGLRGAEGRPVRSGIFYRGGALAGLNDDQCKAVDQLGLRFILDLRAAGEVEGNADYVPHGVEYLRVPGMYDEAGNEVDFSPAGIARIATHIRKNPAGFMSKLYASMMFGNPAVHALVEHLVTGRTPVFVHCTAGKDRTGVCAAIILMLLGVSDDDIVREFLLTNEYRANIINMDPKDMPEWASEDDRRNWAKMNGVNESDLRGTFAAVDSRYGSREEYFAEEFGFDALSLATLRSRYLISPDMPEIPVPPVYKMLDTPYVKVYDLTYPDGTHYFDASRHDASELRALKNEKELSRLLPDAVSCCLVLAPADEEPRLVLFYEYRYPTGQYVLSIPSGLVDQQDRRRRFPLVAAMVREIYEETGIAFGARDSIKIVNPMLFNSPGMTDESTALLCAVIRGTDASSLSQAGACGTERFGGFELVTKEGAKRLLNEGRDRFGRPYPMVTWTALTIFATGQWKQEEGKDND